MTYYTGFYFTPYDLAIFINEQNLNCQEAATFLDNVWDFFREYLDGIYYNDIRKLVKETYYWCSYLNDKPTLDNELLAIKKDLDTVGIDFAKNNYTAEFTDIDRYFKFTLLRLKFFTPFIRIKMRTLLKLYGYKRRSVQLISHINQCMEFYQIQSFLRGGEPCCLNDIHIDDMIIFKQL